MSIIDNDDIREYDSLMWVKLKEKNKVVKEKAEKRDKIFETKREIKKQTKKYDKKHYQENKKEIQQKQNTYYERNKERLKQIYE
jgi:hypothetical protein